MPLPAIWVNIEMATASEGLISKKVRTGIQRIPAPRPVNITMEPTPMARKWTNRNLEKLNGITALKKKKRKKTYAVSASIQKPRYLGALNSRGHIFISQSSL